MALKYEIEKSGLKVRSQVALPMHYEDIVLEVGYRLDLVVESKVLIELKPVEMIANLHHKQALT